MAESITTNFLGANVTVGITGLPITITGRVMSGTTGVLTLQLPDGRIVKINESLIAFYL